MRTPSALLCTLLALACPATAPRAADLTIFTNAYFASQPVADYNRDGNIDSLDAAQYMTDYLNGCNTAAN